MSALNHFGLANIIRAKVYLPGCLITSFVFLFCALFQIDAYEKNLYYHTNEKIELQAARFPLVQPVVLKSVRLILAGKSERGKCRLRIFGNEGGGAYPFYEKDLIEPILITKEQKGRQELLVKIPDLIIKSNQFFIAIDSLSKGVEICTDKINILPECSSDYETYSYQSVKQTDGSWFIGDSYYHILPEIELLYSDIDPIFSDISPEAFPEDSIITDDNIVIFDYNNDDLPDIILNKKLYRNHGNMIFSHVEYPDRFLKKSEFILSADLNNDGEFEILSFPRIASAFSVIKDIATPGVFADSIFMNKTAIVKSVKCADLNADGMQDLVILRNTLDSLPEEPLILLNQGDYCFREYLLPSYSNGITTVITDIDGDGMNDMYIVNNKADDEIFLSQIRENKITYEKTDYGIESQSGLISTKGSRNFRSVRNDGENEIALLTEPGQMIGPNPTSLFLTSSLSNYYYFNDTEDIEFEEHFTGAQYIDVNNDGLSDLILSSERPCRHAALYLRDENGKLNNFSWQSGFNGANLGEDFICEDFDLDGKTDLVTIQNGRLSLYRNQSENTNSYIKFKFRNKGINSITVYSDCGEYYADGNNQSGIKKQRTGLIHVGTGESEKTDSVRIIYADGSESIEYDCIINSINEIEDKNDNPESGKLSVSIFPNPVYENARIIVISKKLQKLILGIYDLSGRQVAELFSGNIDPGTMEFEWICNGSGKEDIPSGVYLLKAGTAQGEIIKKIVKSEK